MFYWRNKKAIRLVSGNGLKLISLLLLSLTFLVSCEQKNLQHSMYYPIDSVLSAQVAALASSKASINKTTWFNKKKIKTTITPATDKSWLKELDVFMNIETLNKSINQGAYNVTDEVDKRSNLKIKVFTSNRDLPIAYVKVYYEGTLKNIRRIESRSKESNPMYKSERILYMEFDDVYRIPLLTGYSIQGGQKMFLSDSVQYRIDAEISGINIK